ncbi:MAG: acetyltransferase [Candidatus Abyssobacteria bacterium SURF_5]|uniref:Acetyltransferase n=1 Tax=Abyssobacteria bacterium (strain SURF_5) TaxID=2093360 RepID=A0A3A4P1A3_ABYX5|nr:MAG: acetyltransferase [Candidatus Abyssubacteria bacterium SURF_5]
MKKIVLWGATGQAVVLEEFLPLLGYRIISVFDNDASARSPFPNVPIYYGMSGFKEWKARNNSKDVYCLVAIGGPNGKDRLEIQNFLEKQGLISVVAVHPKAFVASTVKIGAGTQVLANSAICARASLGLSAIVNTSASIDHECVIGDGVHVGPGATLAGCVWVGNCSFIGAGAVVLPRIRIGERSIIGAGSIVTKDIPDDTVAFGVPAEITGKRDGYY